MHLKVPGEPLWVDADPARIDQVLDNVLGTAARYSPSGGEIEVRVEHADDAVIYSLPLAVDQSSHTRNGARP